MPRETCKEPMASRAFTARRERGESGTWSHSMRNALKIYIYKYRKICEEREMDNLAGPQPKGDDGREGTDAQDAVLELNCYVVLGEITPLGILGSGQKPFIHSQNSITLCQC